MLILILLIGFRSSTSKADPKAPVPPHRFDAGPYCANGGYCIPPVGCAPWYLSNFYEPSASCSLAPGTPGVCCPSRLPSCKLCLNYVSHTHCIANIIPDKKIQLLKGAADPPGSKTPLDFDLYTLNHAAKVGELEVAWIAEFEKELDRQKIFVSPGTAAFNHFAFFKSKPIARKMSDESSMIIFASQSLAERFNLTPNQAGFGLNAFSTKNTILGPNCPKGGSCSRNKKYRSYDGSCNNQEHPIWGTSNSPFQRVLLPAYSDGVFKPRQGKAGDVLPSPRLVSINIVPDIDAPSDLDTHNVMQWGQFVDHDVTHTPLFRLNNKNSSGIQCCMEDGSSPISSLVLHPECFPIEIPENDPFFKSFDQRCMNFVRSMPGPQQTCTFGYGEQMNQITHFHDASNVYGSHEEDAKDLREFRDGLLKSYKSTHSKGLLPQEEGDLEGEECQISQKQKDSLDRKCFKAGIFHVI
jgi:peroxidase